MKLLVLLSLIFLMDSFSFAYDSNLFINVKKVSSLLNRAHSIGVSSDGAKCEAEIRRIEDGYYTLLLTSKSETIFIGLDLKVYGETPVSAWTKRSFVLHEKGDDGSQGLLMKEQFSTKKLMIKVFDDLHGQKRELNCYHSLK